MADLEWEQVDDYHKRAFVPGGWLVKAYEDIWHDIDGLNRYGHDWRVAMCFVPDPDHSWVIGQEQNDD